MYTKNGETLDIFLRAFANKDHTGKILSLVGIHTDISEKKKIEKELRKSKEIYKEQSFLMEGIFNAIPDVIGIQDLDHNILQYNKAGYEFLNIEYKNIKGKKCYHFIGADKPCDICASSMVYQSLKPARVEKYFPQLDLWFEIGAYPVFNDKKQLVKIVEHLRDITKTKQNELQIKKQLSEKEILLKEVHHRIKNNIASIQSLLAIQATSANPEANAILNQAVQRINCIYNIYEKLLVSKSFQSLSVQSYFKELIELIFNVSSVDPRISIITDIDEFTLDVDYLFSLGIITNELITNSLKYAFDKKEQGQISFSLRKNEDKMCLIIEDNGKGLPPDFDLESSSGLGLNLLHMLVEQLRGDIEITNQNGVKYTINFR